MKGLIVAATAGAAAAGFVCLAPPAAAAVLEFELGVEYSGATAPQGAPPWLRATFDDGGTPGSVTLSLEAVNLTDAEFVSDWRFNLDPALDPDDLVFSAPAKTGTFDDPDVSTGVDFSMAPGDGKYDIHFAFATNNGMGGARRFGDNGVPTGDVAVYTISGIPTLTAGSFDFPSAPAGGAGPFPTAAHVQGIGPDDVASGQVTVPEPGTGALLAAALAALAMRRGRRRR